MHDRFSQPVLIDPAHGEPLRIETATEGFAALGRGGLGGFMLDKPEWQVAYDRLARARLDPTEEKLEAARDALQRLVALH